MVILNQAVLKESQIITAQRAGQARKQNNRPVASYFYIKRI
jgi:hypothetical protein